MKSIALLLVATLSISHALQAVAQEVKASAPDQAAASIQQELESKFISTLTNATFTGRWSLIKDGALTPEKQDKYTIVGVTKLQGGKWTINARMQYDGRDFVVPVPATVKWAGDAAVICIDDLSIPGGGTYTARVLVHNGAYAGTWGGGKDHVGLISGAIKSGGK